MRNVISLCLGLVCSSSLATAAGFPSDRADYSSGFPSYFSNNRTGSVSLTNGPLDRWTVAISPEQIGDAGYISFTGSSIRLISNSTSSASTRISIKAQSRTRFIANWSLGHYFEPSGTRDAAYRLGETWVPLAALSSNENDTGRIDVVIEKGQEFELRASSQAGSAALDLWNLMIREDDDGIGAKAPTLSLSGGTFGISYTTERRNNLYVLEESTDLATWSVVPGSTKLAGNNVNTLIWNRSAESSRPRIFFRVKLANE